MQVTVEPEALAEWSAHARRVGTRLDAGLAALDRDLAPLARTWHGAAADGFADRHRQWRQAASGLLHTLALLAALVETARSNYLAVDAANRRTWWSTTGVRDSARPRSVLHAMAAGRGRIRADVDDIRTSVKALVTASDDLVAAWATLATRLSGSAAMAGGDDAGAAFGADYDVMAAAAWQGWRRCLLMIDGIAGGLAATGNKLAEAERASTAGTTAPFLPITARTTPVPGPGPPPTAGGPPTEPFEVFWPPADPGRLRGAADAWRASAAGVGDSVDAVFAAVDALTRANPDATLAEMRRFTGVALSVDPTAGLAGVLAGTGGRIASACSGLADLTERTRARILASVVHYSSGDEWYHPVADALDVFVRFKPGRFLAGMEDAYLLRLALSSIHDEHDRAVASLRGELHPAGADRLARIAAAVAPPTPVPADTCMLASPEGAVGVAMPEPRRQALVDEVVAAGHKISPADVVHIARAPDGRVVWLERGDDRAGLSHILRAGRIGDFARRGVAYAEIPGLAVRAVTQGTWLGRVRDGGDAYDVDLGGGRSTPVVVVVGSNGYVVTARPLGVDEVDMLQRGGR